MSVHPMLVFEGEETPKDWDHAPCALAVVSESLVVLRANRLFLRLVDKDENQVIGTRLGRTFNKAGQLYVEGVLIPLLHLEGSCREVALTVATREKPMPVLVNISLRTSGNSRVYDVAIFPASGRRSFEEQVLGLKQESERRASWLAQLEALSGIGAWTYELRTKRMLWSPKMRELYGALQHPNVSLEEMLMPLGPDIGAALEAMVEDPLRSPELIEQVSDFQGPSGQLRRVKIAARYGFSNMGEPVIQGVVQDITEAYSREVDLWNAAHIDQMTGLGNRYLFNRELARCTEPDKPLAFDLLVVDLDGFKDVNDTFGHQAGDVVLGVIGRRIAQLERSAGFRLGGDEFALIVEPGAEDFAAKLLAEIRRPIDIGAQDVSVNASIGIASYPLDGRCPNSLLQSADLAMYAVKKAGKTVDACL